MGVQQQFLKQRGKLLALGGLVEARLPRRGLRVDVRIERLIDRLNTLQPRAEFDVIAEGHHLEEAGKPLPLPRR